MPHLQFEVSEPLDDAAVDAFVTWVTELFSDVMATGTAHVAVTVRDDVAVSIGRADDAPVAVLNADIRAGRSAAQRREFATTVIDELEDRWSIPTSHCYVVFTEHPGEDFHLDEGPLSGWSSEEGEAGGPIG